MKTPIAYGIGYKTNGKEYIFPIFDKRTLKLVKSRTTKVFETNITTV